MSDTQNVQIEIAERLQLLWLQRMETLLTTNAITSTDLATLAKVLRDNGWTLDKSKLPERLKNKLTDQVSPDELADPRLKLA